MVIKREHSALVRRQSMVRCDGRVIVDVQQPRCNESAQQRQELEPMARVAQRHKKAVHVRMEVNQEILIASVTVPANACKVDLCDAVGLAKAQ